MRLYIAEKPSMAEEIAKCLPGKPIKKAGYFETGDGIVTWGYGHILQLADPSDYDKKYGKWNMSDLPIIPAKWKLVVSPSSTDQFNIIKKLIAQDETTEIIHAGDPDREGQLLIDEVLEYVRNKKPVKRLIINALDEKTIKRGLSQIKDNAEYFNLQQSALARSRADWLIGMNLSRAFTLAAQRAGHDVVMAIGRVKTPTVALVVHREEEIKNFKPVNYHIIKVLFQHQNGSFQTTWQAKDIQQGLDSEGRLTDKVIATELVKRFNQETKLPIIASCDKTTKKEAHRLPFSLSALQIMAGKKYGYSPQTVLETAQSLYEKKLTTYPRSDCDYLPESQIEDGPVIVANLKQIANDELSRWAQNTDTAVKSRAWNDKKITAHHAIIPTTIPCKYESLSQEEQNLYYLIAQAYIAQFYPVHVYNHTKITVNFSDEVFTASGRVIVEDGWRSLYRKGDNNDEDTSNDDAGELPAMANGDTAEYKEGTIVDKSTTPPSRLSTGTLIEAMKQIHKFVKNPELKKQLKDVSGIGTEATRATIISEIIEKKFLVEEKKHLRPTERAYLLVSLLPDELIYPDSTAEWEMTFEKMLDGSSNLNDFIEQQQEFISYLCQKATTMEITPASGITCPTCKQGILRNRTSKHGVFWACSRHPECNATYRDVNGKPDLTPPIPCPTCKTGKLRLRNGPKGEFWGCSNYPACTAKFDNQKGKPVPQKSSRAKTNRFL